MHAMNINNVRRWVALSEGAGGTVGWLTVRHYHITALTQNSSDTPSPWLRTDQRKERGNIAGVISRQCH